MRNEERRISFVYHSLGTRAGRGQRSSPGSRAPINLKAKARANPRASCAGSDGELNRACKVGFESGKAGCLICGLMRGAAREVTAPVARTTSHFKVPGVCVCVAPARHDCLGGISTTSWLHQVCSVIPGKRLGLLRNFRT